MHTMGYRHIIKFVSITAAILMLTVSTSSAQPKSIGATFSYTGFSISYEHGLKDRESFIDISLKGETSEVFLNRNNYPGVSGSFTWNIYIKKWLSRDGNPIRLYAGPGAIIGYSPDFKTVHGLFFGMKGRVGVECEFPRDIVLSISISPIIGSHIVNYGNHMTMKCYMNGIYYSLIPEIGIKYNF